MATAPPSHYAKDMPLSRRIAVPFILLGVTCGVVALTVLIATRQNDHARAGSAIDADAATADWPQYRGDRALTARTDGHLPPTPTLRWRFNTGGSVMSSAVIVGDLVYVGSNDRSIYALRIADGTRLWSYPTGGEIEAPPTVIDQTVYVGSGDAFLYALDAQTGKQQWRYETGDKIVGAVNWFRSPGTAELRLIFGSHDHLLHCVDAAAGTPLWTYTSSNYINGTPAIANGAAVFGGCDGLIHIVDLTNGQSIASRDLRNYIAGSAAIADGRAFVGHTGHELACVNIGSAHVEWTYRDREFPFFTSPAVGEKLVLIGSHDQRLHAVHRAGGEPAWTFPARGNVDSSPVICGDEVVFASDDGRLYIVMLADGRERWSYQIGSPIKASPAVGRGLIVVGADDGTVYAFAQPR